MKGLAATNKYGSEGAGGVIVVKTNVNPEQINSGKNILRPKKAKPKKQPKLSFLREIGWTHRM